MKDTLTDFKTWYAANPAPAPKEIVVTTTLRPGVSVCMLTSNKKKRVEAEVDTN